MNYVYDIETYPNVFTFSCECIETGDRWYYEISIRRNDLGQFIQFLLALRDSGASMIGFNNIHFDYPVIHHILQCAPAWMNLTADAINGFIYQKAQSIINSQDRYGHIIWQPIIKQIDLFKIHHFDNKAKSTSLKMLEFNMRMTNICDLPFPSGTFLTPEQMPVLAYYNMEGDVEATVKFYHYTKPMIDFRESMTAKYDDDYTNYNDGKIGSSYFIMKLEEHAPGTCYYYDENNKRKPRQTSRVNGVPINEIIFPYVQFRHPEFNRILQWMRSQVLTSKEWVTPTRLGFNNNNRVVEIVTKGVFKDVHCIINDFKYDFGTGGIHGSLTGAAVVTDDQYAIIDLDVASYYPNLAIVNRIFPEHLNEVFCDIYKDIYEQRKTYAKKTVENTGLKYALNVPYGQSNSIYSPFFDPKYTMSITINGQLLLCMLAELLLDIPGLSLIQINTDGLTVKVHRNYRILVEHAAKQWETITGLELESVDYKAMYIRDVNNYIGVYEDGSQKVYNKKSNNIPSDAVYIGRPSKFGNPFEIGKDGNREEVIYKYHHWILQQPELLNAVKEELKGKNLVCWCAPEGCHGDVLLKLANPVKTKTKGAYESKQPQDRTPLGWHQNMSAMIVPKAAEAALVHGVSIEEFIRSPERDIMDFMCRAKVDRSSTLQLVADDGTEQPQQRVSRYVVAHQGGSLVKVSPPTKPHTVGAFKKAAKITDAQYFQYDPHVWNETVHTKNQGTYIERRTGIEVGWKVEVLNDIRYVNASNINHAYYISEAHKLVDSIR